MFIIVSNNVHNSDNSFKVLTFNLAIREISCEAYKRLDFNEHETLK